MWWVYDDREGSTVLEPLSGGEETELASIWSDTRFPLLVKTLHTFADLSLQVHPGVLGSYPRKDETWVILAGNGTILAGLKPGADRKALEEALDSRDPIGVLQKIDAVQGMTLHLPAGTLHSLGAGLAVLEVQINCDVTYRLWDWERTDSLGNPRPLHRAQALEAVDWRRGGRPVFPAKPVIDGGDYTLERVEGPLTLGPWDILFSPPEPSCLVSDGSGGRFQAPPGSWKVVMKS